MSRRIVGPFNRVEGDLEVHLDIGDSGVNEAWVVSPLYRGFEQILHGKDPRDAMVYTPRICGICSVSQSTAAAAALADMQGLAMPDNGRRATNLILANENVADHLTHFYLFFMPDFAREVYRDEPWFDDVAERFKAMQGSGAREMLPARAEFMHLMGLLAGKWPHSLAIQPGGTTRGIEARDLTRIRSLLFGFRRFLESTVYGDALDVIAGLDSTAALRAWQSAERGSASDFRRFLAVADALRLDEIGRASDRFLSYGAYPMHGEKLFRAGVWHDGEVSEFDPDGIVEDLSHSWMSDRDDARHPYDGVTVPEADAPDGYTWCKAPRLDGNVVEVGALARQLIDGQPLIVDLVNESGGNVRNRVIARLLEVARVCLAMQTWADGLVAGESCCNHAELPDSGQGFGVVEAARGSLGHWVRVEDGAIANYQIVSPTTWNFSPRDAMSIPGALEQALVGAPVRAGEKDPVSVQHIVRSFDPCMVCTVH